MTTAIIIGLVIVGLGVSMWVLSQAGKDKVEPTPEPLPVPPPVPEPPSVTPVELEEPVVDDGSCCGDGVCGDLGLGAPLFLDEGEKRKLAPQNLASGTVVKTITPLGPMRFEVISAGLYSAKLKSLDEEGVEGLAGWNEKYMSESVAEKLGQVQGAWQLSNIGKEGKWFTKDKCLFKYEKATRDRNRTWVQEETCFYDTGFDDLLLYFLLLNSFDEPYDVYTQLEPMYDDNGNFGGFQPVAEAPVDEPVEEAPVDEPVAEEPAPDVPSETTTQEDFDTLNGGSEPDPAPAYEPPAYEPPPAPDPTPSYDDDSTRYGGGGFGGDSGFGGGDSGGGGYDSGGSDFGGGSDW